MVIWGMVYHLFILRSTTLEVGPQGSQDPLKTLCLARGPLDPKKHFTIDVDQPRNDDNEIHCYDELTIRNHNLGKAMP